jgi:hypothetical protein
METLRVDLICGGDPCQPDSKGSGVWIIRHADEGGSSLGGLAGQSPSGGGGGGDGGFKPKPVDW